MLHTELEKHLQGLSLEETLALAQLALKQAKKKAKMSSKPQASAKRDKALKTLKAHIKKVDMRLPANFKFSREEANARR